MFKVYLEDLNMVKNQHHSTYNMIIKIIGIKIFIIDKAVSYNKNVKLYKRLG